MVSSRHKHDPLVFPKGFLWGAATSSHQVEGDNDHNDWWQAECDKQIPHRSGKASDHYRRYEEDFALAQSLGHNAHRLSIEWSRLEPHEGEWNEDAFAHYEGVFKSLKAKNITILLTLHHFTNPQWFAKKGGWERGSNVAYFCRYVEQVAKRLGKYVDYWITINEPGVYYYMGYVVGEWVPRKKNKLLGWKVYRNMARAHKRAYAIIHRVRDTKSKKAMVGIANNVISYGTYHKHRFLDQVFVYLFTLFGNHSFYLLTGRKRHDFLGINYYFRIRLKRKKGHLIPEDDNIAGQDRETNDLGWEVYPYGIFDVLMDLADYKKPIIITENGIAAANDDRRVRFIVAYMREVYHAIKAGSPVVGHMYWSLMDNFEWADGFDPQFGMIGIEYDNDHKRVVRNSARVYADMIKHNAILHEHLKHLGHN